MPGENDNMVGDYTAAELQKMSPDALKSAVSAGFKKSTDSAVHPSYAGVAVPTPDAIPTAGWKRKKDKSSGEDFVCPSGQKCRLKPLQVEELLLEGILDQVTRLDGMAQELVNIASGLPPEQQKMPSREDFATLLELVNKVTLMAVVEPRVYPDGDSDAGADDVCISDIDLTDRIAILNQALSGVKKLDKFRQS